MALALLSAQRSKDPNTKVGACIVTPENKIVGIGYNGMPIGLDDSIMPWERSAESQLDTKYPYVCHAELNAILNSIKDISGCTLYVTLYPCNECAKAIIQSGIKKLVYHTNKYPDADSTKAAELMLRLAHIEVEQYIPDNKEILLCDL
jgi:dCMP deaminase